MEQILVTGAGGVVGRALLERLRTEPTEVISLESHSVCDLESYPETAALFKFVKPTHVYHLAAKVLGIGGNLKFPADMFRSNILINTNVIEACRQMAVEKIVAMGTVAIYSDELSEPFEEKDAMGGRPHSSEESYGFAKRAMLVQLESYAKQHSLNFCYAIATNMYGPFDRFDVEYGHVIPSLIAKFSEASRNGSPVTAWGDGTPTRDFLYSEDAAAGLMLLMTAGQGSYNLASGRSCSIASVVDKLMKCYPGVTVVWDKSKPAGQRSRSYDVSRLRALGFSPRYSNDEGLEKTVRWYDQFGKKNGGRVPPVGSR